MGRPASGVADLAARRAGLGYDNTPETRFLHDGPTTLCTAEREPGWRLMAPGPQPLWFLDDRVRWLCVGERVGELVHRDDPVERFRIRAEGPAKDEPFDAEVWVDDHGRLRLVAILGAWRRSRPARPRARALAEWVFGSEENPKWEITELFDFGAPADIELPARVLPPITRRNLLRHV